MSNEEEQQREGFTANDIKAMAILCTTIVVLVFMVLWFFKG